MLQKKKQIIVALSTALLLTNTNAMVVGATGNKTKATEQTNNHLTRTVNEPTFQLDSDAAILFDMKQNKVIYQKNPNQKIPTASLAKVMTMLIASEEMEAGNIQPTDVVTVSEKAWKTEGSTMFLEAGRQVTVSDLFQGIALVSGNDACVVMAEHIAGSTDKFVEMMNKRASELGMKDTRFVSVNGLTEGEGADASTANDLLKLGKYYIENFESNLQVHSQKSFAYDNGRGVIEQKNGNPILDYPGGDGLKTGWVEDHFNLIATAKKDGARLIAVTLSAPSPLARKNDSTALMDYGFQQYAMIPLGEKGQMVEEIPVYKSKVDATTVYMGQGTDVKLHSSQLPLIKEKVVLPDYLTGGLKKGDVVGQKEYYIDKKKIASVDIYVNEDIPKSGFISSFVDSFALFFDKLTGKFKA